MKPIFLAITLLLGATQAWSQTEEVKEEKVYNFAVVESIPVFPGCNEDLNNKELANCLSQGIAQVIIKNFVYPKKAAEQNLEDKVFVSFIVERNGKVKHVSVEKGKYELLNKEAVRLLKKLPRMKPAMQDGKTVRMQYTVPINFKLR